jgi:ribosomal protein S13
VLATSVPTTAFLYVSADLAAAGVSAAFTTSIALALYRSFREKKSLQASPQFTRQNLREREGGPE